LIKLIYDKCIDWDEIFFTILFSYRIAYKVVMGYIPFRLVHGLHPLLLIENMLLIYPST
jgi:hypothetical protein